MALGKEQVYRSFIKGFVTEASPLTFPENTSIDEDNFVLNRDGSRERRLGVDFESAYELISTGLSSAEIQTGKQSFHSWNTSSGSASRSIGVVRICNKLWFLDLLSTSPSANLLNGGSPITISGLNGADIETTVINASLVIASQDLTNPILLSYDPVTDTVSQSTVSIKVRDIWGVYENYRIDERPSTLTSTHTYNLRNQGWSKDIGTDTVKEAILNFYDAATLYPSNSDNWVVGRNSNPGDGNFEKFQGAELLKNGIGNTPAPIGSKIIDAFNRGSSRTTEANVAGQNKNVTTFVSAVSGLPTDRETGNITSIATFAGRLFYSGVNSSIIGSDAKSPNYSNYVFFSQVVTNSDRIGKCYQDADPTAASINDMVDSDGGTVAIPECTQILKIIATKASLLVFGDNGVWELYGDVGGFTATSFQVAKISTSGIHSKRSVLAVGNSFMYWSKSGIYTIQPEPVSGRFVSNNISLQSIQTYFLNIPDVAKSHIKGYFDEKQNKCRWLFNDSDSYSETNYVNSYNKELVFDLTLQAFYKNSISSLDTNSPFVADYIDIPGFSLATQTTSVLADTDLVEAGTDQVIVDALVPVNKSSQFAFLTMSGTSFTLSKYNNTSYTDWQTAGSGTGKSYSSYLITGYDLFGDLMRPKTTPYIKFYLHRSEDGYELDYLGNLNLKNQSSCLVQTQWNWANSAASGKWGTQFQAYRLLRNYIPSGVSDPFDYGDSVVTTKHKLRGSGQCLSLKIESEPGKALHLLGWGVTATAVNNV